MPSQKLLDLVAEIQSKQAEISPQIEGLHDFDRLNINPQTKQVIQTAIADYERRNQKMGECLNTLNALNSDGYPELPARTILGDLYDDLKNNVLSIQAAFGKFKAQEEAASAVINPGDPEPKP